MNKIRTHYDNLKVARDAPVEVIRAAYKSLCLKYHPDRNANSPESQRAMKIINDSYAVLSDPERRRAHDAWISEKEGGPRSEPMPKAAARESPKTSSVPIKAGCILFKDLSDDSKNALMRRLPTKGGQEFGIKLDGVVWNYIWSFLLLGWLVFLAVDSTNYRWDVESRDWYAGISLIAALLLGRNLSFIFSWHSSPIKSWLLVTPLYVIKTNLDKVWYWPGWTISDIRATHNYRNGFYQSTSLNIWFEGKCEAFSISPEKAYQALVNKLKEYDAVARAAFSRDDFKYFIDNDDFATEQGGGTTNKVLFRKSSLASYALALALSGITFVAAWEINQGQPNRPISRSSDIPRFNSQASTQSQGYIRPSAAPNGAAWPLISGYIDGYEYLNTNGLSSVNIDNTRNDSDVFVRLVHLSDAEAIPVRSFFVAQGRSFNVQDVAPGRYDVRYQDLNTGALARSEPFTLTETPSFNGTQFDQMTMTLYKVRDGNMRTYGISPDEFF
ncbi:MAG: hypothetical protein CMQ46_02920 [Gammaproteobacteria bacterium]|nr:hypothetical protein [Gammaproteobacteria bacterium]MBJ54200.1 hypothetical protein [Gammaproteobacteria bacterium]|tara:strand:- start:656 stop:2152 length:1497 start_codon:yes stop_codon:yes gene_type:complete